MPDPPLPTDELDPTPAPLRVLVVDDEPLGRKRVLDLLTQEADVEVVGVAKTGEEAIEAIRRERPDVVFLDVRMPDVSGLDVVRAVGPASMPVTVFVTAYDHHAIEAFQLAALDYLLKPFEDERFYEALGRAREAVRFRTSDRLRERYLALLQEAAEPSSYLTQIPVVARGRRRFVPVERVRYVAADGVYAEIHAEGEVFLIRESIQTLKEQLDPAQFYRIHRSTLVRLDRIEEVLIGTAGDYAVRLGDGTQLRLARGRRSELERRLKTLP